MKVKLYWDEVQLQAAADFIAKNNPAFLGRPEYVRSRMIEIMEDLAQDPNSRYISTMGFLVKIATYLKEDLDNDENSIWFDVFVDASVGNIDYLEAGKEIDVF